MLNSFSFADVIFLTHVFIWILGANFVHAVYTLSFSYLYISVAP